MARDRKARRIILRVLKAIDRWRTEVNDRVVAIEDTIARLERAHADRLAELESRVTAIEGQTLPEPGVTRDAVTRAELVATLRDASDQWLHGENTYRSELAILANKLERKDDQP